MARVEVQRYDAEWPRIFERIYAQVWPAVQHSAMALEHVGSTAVPGLRAKPVVDACIIVASPRDIPPIVKALGSLGYVHRGDLGVPEREAFRHAPSLPKHHLYASHRHSLSVKNHLSFRNYLRSHPAAVEEYGKLKEALAQQFPEDIDSYIAGKTDFILGILRKAGLSEGELAAIRAINQIDTLPRPDPA